MATVMVSAFSGVTGIPCPSCWFSIRVSPTRRGLTKPSYMLSRRLLSRSLATLSPSVFPTPSAFRVFDRVAKQKQRDRAVERGTSKTVDYVREEVAERLIERMLVRYIISWSNIIVDKVKK